jgi:hypothetical protein
VLVEYVLRASSFLEHFFLEFVKEGLSCLLFRLKFGMALDIRPDRRRLALFIVILDEFEVISRSPRTHTLK